MILNAFISAQKAQPKTSPKNKIVVGKNLFDQYLNQKPKKTMKKHNKSKFTTNQDLKSKSSAPMMQKVETNSVEKNEIIDMKNAADIQPSDHLMTVDEQVKILTTKILLNVKVSSLPIQKPNQRKSEDSNKQVSIKNDAHDKQMDVTKQQTKSKSQIDKSSKIFKSNLKSKFDKKNSTWYDRQK